MTVSTSDLAGQVLAAQADSQAADAFIAQYMPFIRSETIKFTHVPPEQGHEDELSIAMFAFYQAMLSYQRIKGPFLSYAARIIRHRLIDEYRKQQRHSGVISLYQPQSQEEEAPLLEQIPDHQADMGSHQQRMASQEEIAEFSAQLDTFGITFSQVADNCPKQERTLRACGQALAYARSAPQLLDQMVATRRLPLAELAKGAGVERKTLERHRKYLVAILLAFTNGYEIIRGHLCHIHTEKGGNGQ